MISLEIGLAFSDFGIQIVLQYQQIMNDPLNVGLVLYHSEFDG
jgi:hypothetical protein